VPRQRGTVHPNGVATETTHDALGRLVTSTVKAVSGCDTNYDPLCGTDITSSRSCSAGGGPLATETRPLGGVSTYTYDARGRVASVTRTVSSTLSERMEYDYDAASGKKSAERVRDNRTGSWVTRRSDSYLYDQQDRLSQLTHPDSTTITYTYDPLGRVLAVKDENHSTANTHYAYDPAGRLQTVTQTLTGVTGNAITTSYAYDVHGNLTGVTDPNGNVTSYVYDDFGRMLWQTSPVTGTTTYSYDLGGNLVSTTSANSRTTVRTYDELGRVTEADSTGGSATETVTWAYDSTDQHFGLGRLTLMSDPSGDTAYDYDRQGKIVSDGEGPTTYAYDEDGNLADLGYPSGAHVQYTYDLAGRPVTVTREGTTTVVSSVEYLPFGPLTKIAFGNGTTRESTYDARYRMTGNKLRTASTTLAEYNYTSDDAGNITAIADAVSSTYNRTFGYDDLNRLTAASTGAALWGTGAYTYDRMGNMQSFQLGSSRTGSFTYSGTTPKVATATENSVTTTVTHDAAGNELSGGSTSSFTYSSRNLVESDGTNTYTYDGRGVRVTSVGRSRPHIPPVIRSIYSPDLHLLAQRSEETRSSIFTAELIWMGSSPIAMVSDPEQSPLVTYTFADHLSTPIITTDDSATIVWRAEYEPYGTIYTMRTGSTGDQPLRFPGQEDNGQPESYNIFRWYRSGWGRYTQADPLGAGDLNVVAYAAGNPLRYADPLGLFNVDNRMKKIATMTPEAICGSPFACSLVAATVYCNCHCDASIGYVVADATLMINGSLYYFNGPFGSIKKKTVDPTVKDAATAIAHEYNYHINPAIDAVAPLLKALESKGFNSEGQCQAECSNVAKAVNAAFGSMLKQTQDAENSKK
jgi:RHS repeat-associated protein